MFRDRTPDEFWVSPEEVDAYQAASDPKTIASGLIQKTYLELQLQQTHPWHASDGTLLHMAFAGIAYANDRMAELMRDEAVRTGRNGETVPVDVSMFAAELSRNALVQIDEARKLTPFDSVVFDEQTREGLHAEAMMPWWPVCPAAGNTAEWQHPSSGLVSMGFIRGVIRATKELQADTFVGMRQLEQQALVPVPAEYTSLHDVLNKCFLEPAHLDLETAECLLPVTGKPSTDIMDNAYTRAHDAYIGTMNAYTALFCPPVLGEQWLPDR